MENTIKLGLSDEQTVAILDVVVPVSPDTDPDTLIEGYVAPAVEALKMQHPDLVLPDSLFSHDVRQKAVEAGGIAIALVVNVFDGDAELAKFRAKQEA